MMFFVKVVKEFLRGEYCLYGGSGWWKYEFCYGKKVGNNGRNTKQDMSSG